MGNQIRQNNQFEVGLSQKLPLEELKYKVKLKFYRNSENWSFVAFMKKKTFFDRGHSYSKHSWDAEKNRLLLLLKNNLWRTNITFTHKFNKLPMANKNDLFIASFNSSNSFWCVSREKYVDYFVVFFPPYVQK